ncbi:MAG: DNA repair protein RecO [Moraxellaceae bacterium]|nr:DNA repair protein RecO [Moraxellaceae bacterium]
MTALLHAYFLHTRPYRETSVLVDLFTAEAGRVGGIWRGGRRAKRSIPQLFQPLLVDLQGSGELKTLRQVEPAGPALMLAGPALFSGFYLNELLNRLLPRDEVQYGLFAGYAQILGELAEGAAVESRLRYFERQLLDVLGYGIDFTHDAGSDGMIVEGSHYDFHPERGFVRASPGGSAFPGAVLLGLATSETLSPEGLQVLKLVHRRALARLLGNKPLKSRELFLALR